MCANCRFYAFFLFFFIFFVTILGIFIDFLRGQSFTLSNLDVKGRYLVRNECKDFLNEIKIMGYVDPHLNLVNMLGSCTEVQKDGDLWLLIEFCKFFLQVTTLSIHGIIDV